ncbi:T9SS type A sorting domain-containing protein [Candidatus Fermentibacteria bacterium]|nr:T9SS type A sorting domain-containing protein [Candidatus Fermentibacteria bacterium]
MSYVLLVLALVVAPRHPVDNAAWRRPLVPMGPVGGEEPLQHDFDAVHYDLDIEVFPELEEIEGVTTVRLTPDGSTISQIKLDLVQLAVDSVWDSSGPLSYTQEGDSIIVDLGQPLNPGDTTDVYVSYGGTPWNEGPGRFGGFWFQVYVFYQMGVGIYTDPPSVGRAMFPCWDHPADKATFDFHVTCADTLYAVANGDLVSIDRHDGRAVYNWELDQPMSTYLAAISVSDYTVLTDSTYDWIKYYVYPWEVEDARGSFVDVDKMMDQFESHYGPYPWNCKFSYVETPKGSMEHTSEVYLIASSINGTTNWNHLFAHEMSHMWWGDCVTEAEWSDVWLSEGFATYSEALWSEYYSDSAYTEYMVENIMIPYLRSGETFPLTAPGEPSEYWSYTTYEKGASVLHMLRYVLGDTNFYNALAHYFDHHSFRTATTVDLMEHMEVEYGDTLDWFFDSWAYGEGYPIYDFDYSWQQSGSDWELTIGVDQIQSFSTFFTMPLEFLVLGTSMEDSVVVMWNDEWSDTETFLLPYEPQMVLFDPYYHILSTALLGVEDSPTPPSGGTRPISIHPNPTTSWAEIEWTGVEDRSGSVLIFDLSGRLMMDKDLVGGRCTIDVTSLPSGTYLIEARAEGNLRQVHRLVVVR